MENNIKSDIDHANVQANVQGRPATREEVAYRDGYVNGRTIEERQQYNHRTAERIRTEQNARTREANSASAGLLTGLLLALLAIGAGGLVYYLTQDSEPATTEAPVKTPVERETTIIERTVENTREVVRDAPDVELPDVQMPDVNIQVPETAPAETAPAETAPAAEIAEPAPEAAEPATAE